MAVSLGEILAAMQNGVTAINNLKSALDNIFPQVTALSTTAPTAGTITFSSSLAAAVLSVETSSGGIYKIPLYS